MEINEGTSVVQGYFGTGSKESSDEEEIYSAVCLERWIIASGKTILKAQQNLQAVYRATLDQYLEKGESPFQDIPPVPEKFQKMYKDRKWDKSGTIYNGDGENNQLK